jgi:hypothetical protein
MMGADGDEICPGRGIVVSFEAKGMSMMFVGIVGHSENSEWLYISEFPDC